MINRITDELAQTFINLYYTSSFLLYACVIMCSQPFATIITLNKHVKIGLV